MSAPRQCPSCNSVVEEGDKFCPSCGRDLIRPRSVDPPAASECPLCGQANPATAPTCSACGAKLRDVARAPAGPGAHPQSPKGISAFHSWKVTLGVAAVLVAAVIVLVSVGKTPQSATVSSAPGTPGTTAGDPHADAMVGRMRELQAAIEKNPKDTAASLELANTLYDVGFFDRAAEMYERYLAIAPGNADARVDLGTAYFNMALADSTKRKGLSAKAESCFRKVVETAPRHQMAHFNLGIVHLQQGDMPGAKRWFERCVAIDSTTPIAARALELLSEHLQPKKL